MYKKKKVGNIDLIFKKDKNNWDITSFYVDNEFNINNEISFKLLNEVNKINKNERIDFILYELYQKDI